MKSFEAGSIKRTIVIGLERGDEVLGSVEKAIAEHNIQQGVIVSGIGALSRAVYHRVTTFDEKATDEIITVDSPMELGSMQGFISDGMPHIHVTLYDLEGNGFSGHLEPGSIVLYLGEIVILEFEGGDIVRKPNPFGIKLLAKKS